jgi:hypothetical protein
LWQQACSTTMVPGAAASSVDSNSAMRTPRVAVS